LVLTRRLQFGRFYGNDVLIFWKLFVQLSIMYGSYHSSMCRVFTRSDIRRCIAPTWGCGFWFLGGADS
jgi:hypothetical protein